MMKAFAINAYTTETDFSNLKEMEIPKPSSPLGKDIIVKIKAIATNPVDYKVLSNLGNHTEDMGDKAPFVAGYDASGVVEEVGPEASLFKVGDEVMLAGSIIRAGTFAEYIAIDERIVGRKPSNVSFSQASALPLTHITAWECLMDHLGLTPTDTNASKTVLVVGGAGGVGAAAIQIAKKYLKLNVVATASRTETQDYVRSMGADHVITHREALGPQIEKLGRKGVEYIVNTADLSPERFSEFSEITLPFGRIASILDPSGAVTFPPSFKLKCLTFSVEFMFTKPMTGHDIQAQHELLGKVAGMIEDGTLKSTEMETFDLTEENLKMALRKQSSGKTIGKLTLSF